MKITLRQLLTETPKQRIGTGFEPATNFDELKKQIERLDKTYLDSATAWIEGGWLMVGTCFYKSRKLVAITE